jgi:hypothetical protein
MIALTVIESWAVIGLTVATLILFYAVLNLTAEAFRQWWDAAPLGGEDLSAHEERER